QGVRVRWLIFRKIPFVVFSPILRTDRAGHGACFGLLVHKRRTIMQKKEYAVFRRTGAAVALGVAAIAFTACTTTLPNNQATPTEQRSQINQGADATLSRLYQAAPGSRD